MDFDPTQPITVKAEDGSTHVFNPGTTEAQIKSALDDYTISSRVKQGVHAVAAGGTGVLRAIGGVAGMVPDVHNMIVGAMGGPDWRKMPGGSADIKKAVEGATGITPYQPENQLEKYITSITEGATAMLPFTGKQAVVGGLAGGMGELAGNRPEVSEHPEMARSAAQIATLLAAAPFGMRTPPAVKATKSFVDEVGVPGLRDAAANAAQTSATTGVPTLLTQGMPHREMSGLVQALANSSYGGAVRTTLRDQLPAGEALMKSLYADLPTQGADAILNTGARAIQAPKDVRAGVTAPLYAAANDKVDVMGLAEAMDAARKAKNIPAEYPASPARKLFDRMISDPVTELNGIPALELDTVARKARDAAEKARKKSDTITMQDNYAIKDTIDEATSGNAALQAAKSEHTRLSDELVAPVKKALGKMFPETMREARTGDWSTYRRVFDSADAGQLTEMSKHLGAVDKEGTTFAALFRDQLERKASEALKPVEGRPPETGLNSFANEIAGTPAKKAALEAKVRAVAKAQGKDPNAAWQGTSDTVDALYAISKDRGGINPGAESLNAAASDWVSNLLQYTGIMYPAHGLGRMRTAATAERLAKDLSEAFTTPDGVDKLVDIAKFSALNHKVKAVARGIANVEIPAADENNQRTYYGL